MTGNRIIVNSKESRGTNGSTSALWRPSTGDIDKHAMESYRLAMRFIIGLLRRRRKERKGTGN